MHQRLIARTLSLCLAATLTLVMLGGINELAQPHEAASLWAQQTATRA
jgi:hypothetical protein